MSPKGHSGKPTHTASLTTGINSLIRNETETCALCLLRLSLVLDRSGCSFFLGTCVEMLAAAPFGSSMGIALGERLEEVDLSDTAVTDEMVTPPR
jgi:hypothetical protein